MSRLWIAGLCALLGVAVSSHAGVGKLPEGPGLAARYSADAGIARDKAVLFADDFEGTTGDRFTTGYRAVDHPESWNNRWDVAWGPCLISRSATGVHAGAQSIQFSCDGPGGQGMSRYLPPGHDTVFYRYYVKYHETFPGGHHTGGALESRAPGVPHANPGVVANGTNKYTILLDHWSFEEGVRQPGCLVAYVYHMDQQHEYGEQFFPSGRILPGTNQHLGLHGKAFVPREDIIPERGRWYCYELMVHANTPGRTDGRVAFWVDGRLAADFPRLRFRTVPTLKIDRADLGLYETRRNGPHTVWFDDVVIATSYIGPMAP